MATCPTCKSDRCGNYAACTRKNAAAVEARAVAVERQAAWTLMWFTVGCAERLVREELKTRNPFDSAILNIAFGEQLRTACCLRVMLELERRR